MSQLLYSTFKKMQISIDPLHWPPSSLLKRARVKCYHWLRVVGSAYTRECFHCFIVFKDDGQGRHVQSIFLRRKQVFSSSMITFQKIQNIYVYALLCCHLYSRMTLPGSHVKPLTLFLVENTKCYTPKLMGHNCPVPYRHIIPIYRQHV